MLGMISVGFTKSGHLCDRSVVTLALSGVGHVVPGLMQQSADVVEEAVSTWHTTFFTALAALVLLLCIPGGPLAPVMNTVRQGYL